MPKDQAFTVKGSDPRLLRRTLGWLPDEEFFWRLMEPALWPLFHQYVAAHPSTFFRD
jgi:hypothetical protein